MTAVRVGADIGGTFTDVTLLDAQGHRHLSKVLTTHHDPAVAVLDGLQQVVKTAGIDIRQVDSMIHGTTLVINALIERRGAKTALLCTQGFRHVLDIANENRYDIYDLLIERPEPLVPPFRRYPLPERIYSDGSVITPLEPQAIRTLIPELRRHEVQAVAVSLLHSYKNPQHEQMIAEVLRQEAPDLYLTLSSELVPEIREYPRTSTTVANVYVRPVIEQYLRSLEASLHGLGFAGQFLIMLSNGGTCTVDTACRYPIYILESGPAAGALAAMHYGQQTAFNTLLSFDMGGTTAKSCLIDGSRPMTTTDYEVARMYRFKKGSGLPIKVPVIEMIEIGAGGGSIARIDTLGLLKVGPESAESHPGPVCYGLGGKAPTVTDADLVLGYLDAGFFLGGKMQLHAEAAYQAIAETIATPLGLEPIEAAWGIHQVVNENMASAARVHAIGRGKDPRSYALFAFGGAGPVHACHVSQILDMSRVICPMGAGVASAFGMLCAPLAFDFVRSYYATMVTRKELRCDSGGPGTYRGGLGQEVHLRVLSEAPMMFTAMFDRTKFPARGLNGGGAGASGEVRLDDGTTLAPKGKHTIPAEHTLIMRLPGGGGYGSPYARAPERVLQDVRSGFVSRAQAEAAYGVVIDVQTWTVDSEATARRRAHVPENR